jgi:hypothetical protein
MVATNDPCELAQSHSYLFTADRIVFPKNTTSITQTDLISITSQADPGLQAFGTGDLSLPRLRRRVHPVSRVGKRKGKISLNRSCVLRFVIRENRSRFVLPAISLPLLKRRRRTTRFCGTYREERRGGHHAELPCGNWRGVSCRNRGRVPCWNWGRVA